MEVVKVEAERKEQRIQQHQGLGEICSALSEAEEQLAKIMAQLMRKRENHKGSQTNCDGQAGSVIRFQNTANNLRNDLGKLQTA